MSIVISRQEVCTIICGNCTREFRLILEPIIGIGCLDSEAKYCPFCNGLDLRRDPDEIKPEARP